MQNPLELVYWDEPTLWTAAFNIVLTPIYWLLVSHIELRTRILSRLFCSRHVALFLFAVTLILMTGHRNLNFLYALRHQPKWAFLQENLVLWCGHVLCLVGFFLVLRSSLALGFVATFMGDYFHLRLRQRVTSFPYSWMTHPMYSGAFMLFLGAALVHASQAGLVLSFLAGLMYVIAAAMEEPYTDQFYIPYPAGRRHVGVQVMSSTSLLEVKARTVGVQYKGAIDIIEQEDKLGDFDVEAVETDEDVEAVETDDDVEAVETDEDVEAVETDEDVEAVETVEDVEAVDEDDEDLEEEVEVDTLEPEEEAKVETMEPELLINDADFGDVSTAESGLPAEVESGTDVTTGLSHQDTTPHDNTQPLEGTEQEAEQEPTNSVQDTPDQQEPSTRDPEGTAEGSGLDPDRVELLDRGDFNQSAASLNPNESADNVKLGSGQEDEGAARRTRSSGRKSNRRRGRAQEQETQKEK